MVLYLTKVRDLLSCFKSWQITQVPNMHNEEANSLANLASVPSSKLSKTILIQYLETLNIHGKELLTAAAEQNGG